MGYNKSIKKWCKSVTFIDNETLFEYKSGEVDGGSYIMTGITPAVHLTRAATIRILTNTQQTVPELLLSDKKQDTSSFLMS